MSVDATHTTTQEVNVVDLATPRHAQTVLDRDLAWQRIVTWPTETVEATDLAGRRFVGVDSDGDTVAWYLRTDAGDSVLLSATVRLYGGQVTAVVAAMVEADVVAFIEELREACPATELSDERQEVPVTFWSLGQHGPTSRIRTLAVPSWDDVAGNYVGATADGLGRLVDGFEPGVGGQLLVWHGAAGTGKTNALRTLAWEWREWCSLHYITDPETFFGQSASYMLDVLLADDHDGMAHGRLSSPGAPEKGDEPEPQDRWRLLVLEDTGEMLARDAKDRTGQGLARLLNVVDGMIGQGLRILVLVTTNEELRSLHPAVSRPGRCAANVEFASFSIEEARDWIAERDGTERPDRPQTLADLYATRAGRDGVLPALAGVGFA